MLHLLLQLESLPGAVAAARGRALARRSGGGAAARPPPKALAKRHERVGHLPAGRQVFEYAVSASTGSRARAACSTRALCSRDCNFWRASSSRRSITRASNSRDSCRGAADTARARCTDGTLPGCRCCCRILGKPEARDSRAAAIAAALLDAGGSAAAAGRRHARWLQLGQHAHMNGMERFKQARGPTARRVFAFCTDTVDLPRTPATCSTGTLAAVQPWYEWVTKTRDESAVV